MSKPAPFTRFEDIAAWQRSRALTCALYMLTAEGGCRTDFALCDQLRRAGISVMSNIAEGFERDGNREFIQFLSIAKRSAASCTWPSMRDTLPNNDLMASFVRLRKSASGIFSGRKLEAATDELILMRYICGNLNPDHDTIAAFRKRFLLHLEQFFQQILMKAMIWAF